MFYIEKNKYIIILIPIHPKRQKSIKNLLKIEYTNIIFHIYIYSNILNAKMYKLYKPGKDGQDIRKEVSSIQVYNMLTY